MSFGVEKATTHKIDATPKSAINPAILFLSIFINFNLTFMFFNYLTTAR